MSWTTPRTWVVGDTLTAALFNTHLRDNLLALRQIQDYAVLVRFTPSGRSIPNASWNAVSWDEAAWGVNSTALWASASATILRSPVAGIWELDVRMNYYPNTSGTRELRAVYNGVTYNLGAMGGTSAESAVLHSHDLTSMGASQTAYLETYQGIGAALTMGGGVGGTFAFWRLLGVTT